MATVDERTKHTNSQQGEAWKHIESGALKALTSIGFSTENSKLYPPTCKQHIWQQVLVQASLQAAKLLQNYPTLKLMHGLVSYTPMESFTFHMDAAYKSTQFSKEELIFLRKLRLEEFLCNVPWGVVHPVRATEAITTLQEETLKVSLKGEILPLFSENWRELFHNIFHLSPKGEGEGKVRQLHELFPSLKVLQKGQVTVKVSDCQMPGSKRPLRLLSSFFCLNTTSQYSITIHFAKLVLAAVNGQAVDWPLEFFDEFKAEVISLHRHQQEDKAKVIKTAIGPHLTLLIDDANLLGSQERRIAGFGTPTGLSMTERIPPPRKRKLEEGSSSGKLEVLTRVTPHPSQNTSGGTHDAQATTSGEKPQKCRIIQSAEKWQVPDSTSNMVNQICFTHRRLEQLLTTFTSQAGSEFVKKMDDEFQKLQVQADQQYNQNLRLKEPLTTNEHAVEKGLLHAEISKLKKEITTLNEGYAEQVEMVFELQDQLSASEGVVATLTKENKFQQEQCEQVTKELAQKQHDYTAAQKDLLDIQVQLKALQVERDQQTINLATLEEELRQCLKTSYNTTNPTTPRSGEATPPASGSATGTSALYSMYEEMQNPTESQQRSVAELQQELRHVTRERDELQITVERIFENPPDPNAEPLPNDLNPADVPRKCISPRTVIYQQLITHIPPFSTIMQVYHAFKGLNLLISQVPLLKTGTTLSKPQFEQIWAMADATARDTLAFMWARNELKLPTGIMEVVTGSPPFYIGRFVLRTLSLIGHHHSEYYNHTPVTRLPTLKPYPSHMYHQIKETITNQPITFNQALKTLTTEDTSICYEAVQQFTWLRERHPHRLPGPYTIPQIKEYVLKVIREKETTISTRRFGILNSRTILQPER